MVFDTVEPISLSQSPFVACPAGLSLPRVDVQSLPSPVRDATAVCSCSTLALVTLAVGSACPQLVKSCPSMQLMTHEVRELSGNCKTVYRQKDET